MKPYIHTCITCILVGLSTSPSHAAPSSRSIQLEPLGTYYSGIFDGGGAEIVAHDPRSQRLFVVNAKSATVDVLSIADPSHPTKVWSLDVTPYGAVANSVAVHQGRIAVAVENVVRTEPGRVVFFGAQLQFLAAVPVGAVPDMITFTPDGKRVLVANEGEPNLDYTVDPEGSISIIDVSGDLSKLNASKVRTARFTSYTRDNLDPTIRIFGPNASVAQDLEPEYIAVSEDSKTAWITCQENNALATLDIGSARITHLVGLGFKDHTEIFAQARIYPFNPEQLPLIGRTLAQQPLQLGGFSGLHFAGRNPKTGAYRFVTHTDRGPNGEPVQGKRPFLLPQFTPSIVRFELSSRGQISITQVLPLQSAPGKPLTGLPNTQIAGGNANTPANDELPVDLLGRPLPLDPLGADLEGIVVDPTDSTFWMADEYRPALYHFNAQGVLIQRYVPSGSATAAGLPEGSLGSEALPAVLSQRRQNRGFEAITYDNGRIYAFMQSPLRNPVSLSNTTLGGLRHIRILEFNPTNLVTRQFVYSLDNADLGPEPNTRADKIGDAASLGNGEFLVIERDDDALPRDARNVIEKKVYRFNLNGATDVSAFTGLVGSTGKTLEELSTEELVANKIQPVSKILHVDLNLAGYNRAEKVEGLTILDPWTIAVINDNDFGVANITIQPDGSFVRNVTPELIQLGIITTHHNGIDASDRDSKINIRPWPIKGMYQPDAIAAFKKGSKTFLITANEGDAREYVDPSTGKGYVEALRVGNAAVKLDPVRFPDANALKNNANLGRLNITSALGKNPTTGLYEELYAFGARSFSIWSSEGQLIFDSGDDLEWITAQAQPTRFNASNNSNDFDTRSDDKGPEPEGVVVGRAYGNQYAFIGLERIGGVIVYNINDPEQPRFVQYANLRDFNATIPSDAAGDLGPEGLLFIPEDKSPTGKPLLVVGNEISGTTTLYQISKARNEDCKDGEDDDR